VNRDRKGQTPKQVLGRAVAPERMMRLVTFRAIWRTLGGMRDLSGLSEEERERALSRFHLIQPLHRWKEGCAFGKPVTFHHDLSPEPCLNVDVRVAPNPEKSGFSFPLRGLQGSTVPAQSRKSSTERSNDADKFALGIGIARSSRDCLSLSANLSAFATDPKELLALGDLCLFGQQYEPARASLTKYLSFPQPEERQIGNMVFLRSAW